MDLAIFPFESKSSYMILLTTLLIAVGSILIGKQNFFKKIPTAHQLNRLHSNTFTTDGCIITFDNDITFSEFISIYEYFCKRTCELILKPTIPRYRTNKGYMT